MSYRSDVDALTARKQALDAEIARRTRERDEAAQLLAEATAKLREQERVEQEQIRRAAMPTRGQRAVMAATVMSTLAMSAAVGHYTSAPAPQAPAFEPLASVDDLPLSVAGDPLPDGAPLECHQYYWQIRALERCEALPRQAADALAQAFDDAAKAWGQLPPEALQSLADACAAGRDAVRQATLQVCERDRILAR